MKKLFKFFIDRPLVVNLMMVLILLIGYVFSTQMKREGWPAVDMLEMYVTTVYPGASPEDVELNVTIPLEDELKGISGIKDLSSTSMENLSKIKIVLDRDSSDIEQVKSDIRRAIDSVNTLPKEIKDRPKVIEIKVQSFPVIEVAFSSTTLSTRVLVDRAKDFKKLLEDLPLVSKVETIGIRDREIHIKVDLDKLNANFLTFTDVINAVDRQNINLAGGNLESYMAEKGIITVSRFDDLKDVENIILRSNFEGMRVRLKDVAQVIDTFEKKRDYIRYNGEDGVALQVVKKENADIIRTIDQIKVLVGKFKKTPNSKGVTVHYLNDQSVFTRTRIAIVRDNALIGFVLVVLILFLFLNRRIALWTAVGLPISILMSLSIMHMMGITINTISLAGIIIVLGMLVDDAIIIAENTFRHRKAGLSWKEAALTGVNEVALPVIGTVLSTVFAFMPIVFLGGNMGEFAKEIPIVVSLVLLASLFEGFFILPQHLSHVKARGPKTGTLWSRLGGLFKGISNYEKAEQKFTANAAAEDQKSQKLFAKFDKIYHPMLRAALNHRYKLVIGFVVVLIGSFIFFGTQMKFVLFDLDQSRQFFIVGQTKRGSSLEKTAHDVRKIEESLKLYMAGKIPAIIDSDTFKSKILENLKDPKDKKRLLFYYRGNGGKKDYVLRRKLTAKARKEINAILARSGNRLGIVESFKTQVALNGFGGSENPNFFSFIVYMTPVNTRKMKAAELVAIVRNIVHHMRRIQKSYFQVYAGGPPVGRELEVMLTGYDDKQRVAALKDVMKLFYLPRSFTETQFKNELPKKIRSKKAFGLIALAYAKNSHTKQYHLKADLRKYLAKGVFERKVLAQIKNKQQRMMVANGFRKYLPTQIGLVSFDQKIMRVVKDKKDQALLRRSYKQERKKRAWTLRAKRKDIEYKRLYSILRTAKYPFPERYVLKDNLKKKQLQGVNILLLKAGYVSRGTRKILRKLFDSFGYMVDGVYGIDHDFEMGKDEMRVKLRYGRIARYKLNAPQVAQAIRTAFNGTIVTYQQTQEERIAYRVLLKDKYRRNRATLNRLKIANKDKRLIPVNNLLRIREKRSIKRISHFDAERSITIGANVNPKISTPAKAYGKMDKLLAPLRIKYPKVKFKVKGEAEESAKTMGGLISAFQVAVIAVYFLIVLIFGSFSQPFLVLAAIPFGIIGVIWTFAFHGLNFSLVAVLGVIGLSGVVVNDSLVMIEFINKTREKNPELGLIDGIIQGARMRLRPIFLTTFTTCAGLLPTAYGLGGYDIGIAPMTLAVAWGLVFATALTLLFIPALYLIEKDIRALFRRRRQKGRVIVNPVILRVAAAVVMGFLFLGMVMAVLSQIKAGASIIAILITMAVHVVLILMGKGLLNRNSGSRLVTNILSWITVLMGALQVFGVVMLSMNAEKTGIPAAKINEMVTAGMAKGGFMIVVGLFLFIALTRPKVKALFMPVRQAILDGRENV